MRTLRLLTIALAGCSAQFDFDVGPIDAAAEIRAPEGAPEGAPFDVARDEGAVTDGASAGRVGCGTSACVLPARACCIETQPSCVEVSEATCGGALIRCDSSSDCPGDHVCCATVSDAGPPSAQCRDWGSCRSPDQVVLCDPADPVECASCVPSSLPFPPGYHQCL